MLDRFQAARAVHEVPSCVVSPVPTSSAPPSSACAIPLPRRIGASGRPPCSRLPPACPPRPSPATGCSALARRTPSICGSIASKATASRACPSVRGGGASPLFPPVCPDQATARQELLHGLHRAPRTLGVERTRWTLADRLPTCSWWERSLPSSLGRLLDRLDIRYKQARDHVHSPDPD